MKWFSAIIFLVIGLDQFTKKLAVDYLSILPDGIPIIPGLFSLTFAQNRGVAFGVEFAPPAMLILLTGIITLTVLVYVFRSKRNDAIFLVPFALIVGGGIGNMIDRITVGRVVDFIYFDIYHGTIFGHHVSLWPIFNIADSAITVGACMLVLFHNRIFPQENDDVR
ncbi:MAG: signal peptidase II [Chlorobiaceae bacterium]|nr:signal peptidase II [Chlorobiaceae bacterium]NTV60481.1 signal peptidase II [Chlorobiaceae bacterium]